jgi:hypothetical protein
MQERETAVQKQNQEKGILYLCVLPWRQDGENNVGIVKAVLRCIVSSQMASLVEGAAPRTLFICRLDYSQHQMIFTGCWYMSLSMYEYLPFAPVE